MPRALPALVLVVTVAVATVAGPSVSSGAAPSTQAVAPLFKASTSSYGAPAAGSSLIPSVSADGRWVVFYSNAGDELVPEVTTNLYHVYLKDLDTGRIVLASADAAGTPLPGDNTFPAVDGGGTRVAFRNRDDDYRLYVKDILTGELILASTNMAGEPADAPLTGVSLSGDGSRIAFTSSATNLTPADTDPEADVFVKDLASGEISLVATASDGTPANAGSGGSSISADGNRVAFASSASNLDPRATGADGSAVFVKDLVTGAVTLASCDRACAVAAVGGDIDLSADGQHVVFTSADDRLGPGTTGIAQAWVKNLVTGDLRLASATASGTAGGSDSDEPRVSRDGLVVSFASASDNFLAGGTTVPQVYRKDVRTGRLVLVSQYGGRPSRNYAVEPDMSDGGDVVVFQADGGAFSGAYDGSVAIYALRAGRGAPMYPPPGGSYASVTATRLLDTRSGLGVPAPGPVTPATPVRLAVTGRGGVPMTGVAAVALNVTVVDPAGNGYLTGYAGGAARPATALLNYPARATRAALAVLPVGADGTVTLYTSQRGNLLADVTGWFSTPETASMTEGRWQGLGADRIVDTREPGSPVAPVGPGQKVDVDVETLGGLPNATETVVLNVTAVAPTASGYLTVYPYLQTRPTVSMLNFRVGETVSNRVVVPVVQGKVSIYNSSGTTNLLVDLAGYSTTDDVPPAYSYSAWYVPLPGTRLLDTRGSGLGPLGPAETRSVYLASARGLPQVYGPIQGVVGALAGVDATATGYLTTTVLDVGGPNGTFDVSTAPGPPVSNAVASLAILEQARVYNAAGTTHAVWDVNGVFVCGAYCLRPPGP